MVFTKTDLVDGEITSPSDKLVKHIRDTIASRQEGVKSPQLTRYGAISEKGTEYTSDYVCFGLMPREMGRYARKTDPTFLYTFNSRYAEDGTPVPRLGTGDPAKYMPVRVPTKKEGAEWIAFLLSSESPWRDLHPYLHTTDPEEIAETGYIFKDTRSASAKLLYNFLIATRFGYETPTDFWSWWYLRKEYGDRKAALLANTLTWAQTQISRTDNVHEVTWLMPWGGQHAFLAGTTWPYWGRFMAQTPNPVWTRPKVIGGVLNMPVQEMWAFDDPKLDDKETHTLKTRPEKAFPLRQFKGKIADAVSVMDAEIDRQYKLLGFS